MKLAAASNAEDLRKLISPSMPAVNRGLAERGRSVAIGLAAADTATTPTPAALLALIEMRRSGELSGLEFWYILSAIDLHMAATERLDTEVGNLISDLAKIEVEEPQLGQVEAQLRRVAT